MYGNIILTNMQILLKAFFFVMQSNTSVPTFFSDFMTINNKNVGKHLKFGTWLFVNIITHYL